MKKYFVILFFILSGCITVSTKYTPKNKIKHTPIVKNEDKKNITFSVSYNDLIGADYPSGQMKKEKNIVQTMRKIFEKSNLFKKVHYVTLDNREQYHYHIDVKLSGSTQEEVFATGYASGSLLMLIPFWVTFDIDATMFVYDGDEEIYSITTTERIRDILWLPAIVLSPFFNHLTIRNRILNYFMMEIINNKLY